MIKKELVIGLLAKLCGDEKTAQSLIEFAEENGNVTEIKGDNFVKTVSENLMKRGLETGKGAIAGAAKEEKEREIVSEWNLDYDADFKGLKKADFTKKLREKVMEITGATATEASKQINALQAQLAAEKAAALEMVIAKENELHSHYSKPFEEQAFLNALKATGKELSLSENAIKTLLLPALRNKISSQVDLIFNRNPAEPNFSIREKGKEIDYYKQNKKYELSDFANEFLSEYPDFVKQSAGSGEAGGNGTPPNPPANINKGELYK